MSHEAFDGKMLTDKLSKLNNSQQSIESLSRWCISHRKKSRQIVETWEKLFNSSQKEQCVSFLYLANDILQNSRRKGSEFVNEFWKVLPNALRHVFANGDENGKKAVSRLVDIWEERKVFGSRLHNLKEEILATDLSVQVASSGKNLNPIKIVKKDAQSLRIKVAVGGLPEKIVTAFHSVHDESSNEEAALVKCDSAVISLQRIEKEVADSLTHGQLDSSIAVELQKQGAVLQQCVKALESAEAVRVSLVSQLKEALEDQELQLEVVRQKLHVTRNLMTESGDLRPIIPPYHESGTMSGSVNLTEPADRQLMEHAVEETSGIELTQNYPVITGCEHSANQLHQPSNPIVTSFSGLSASEEDKKKSAAAAAVAAKLAASTSSAQMLSSILSSLAAEEAASSNSTLGKSGFPSNLPIPLSGKRAKLDSSLDASNSEIVGSKAYFSHLQQSLTNMSPGQVNQAQASLLLPHTHPPPASTQVNQFLQSVGMMPREIPFGFGSSGLPPPPPIPSHVTVNLARPPAQQQQQSATGSFYPASGVGLYGQNQPPPPPLYHE